VSPGGRDAVIYGMGSDPAEPARRSRRLLAQGRIVDAVAADLVIAGSAEELARRLGVSTRTFRGAVRELVAAGWVVVKEGPAGRLTVRWERRRRQEPVAVERRRQDAC
jgi:DNA-binding FadR family transcriptional regulator